MCGILAIIGKVDQKIALKQSKLLSHRGPDQSGIHVTSSGFTLCHERLSIMDPKEGVQPLVNEQIALIHNGEIYNHQALKDAVLEIDKEIVFNSHSDSESILHGYKVWGQEVVSKLDGVFSFVLIDGEKVFVARDPVGVKPLFMGQDSSDQYWFSSEMKALIDVCVDIKEFPPGHYFTETEGLVGWYSPDWLGKGYEAVYGPDKIKENLVDSVKKRLMSDVPLGALLSGGLDSSLVCSIAARELAKTGKKLQTFSVGIDGDGSDLSNAKAVADFIGAQHTEVHFSVDEGIDILDDLIQKLESYDVTSIRASTPMYIMSKVIKERGIKVVLSGEGADEIFGGYLYFGHAPSSIEFQNECIRRIKRLYTSDIQRADRATMGVGVEARVPFLDKTFLEYSLGIDAKFKMFSDDRPEKYILRKAFDDKENPYLPDSVLWRQKEQFSDGVGYSWVDRLKAFAEQMVSDKDFNNACNEYPHNTPLTKEAFLYRKIFEKHFPHKDAVHQVKKWIPKWQEYNIDPSGRANKLHVETSEGEERVVEKFG